MLPVVNCGLVMGEVNQELDWIMPQAITICFISEGVRVTAAVGDSWLEVANQAGVEIPTGCLQGSCGACTVEVEQLGEVRTCISAVPLGHDHYDVYLFSDPTW